MFVFFALWLRYCFCCLLFDSIPACLLLITENDRHWLGGDVHPPQGAVCPLPFPLPQTRRRTKHACLASLFCLPRLFQDPENNTVTYVVDVSPLCISLCRSLLRGLGSRAMASQSQQWRRSSSGYHSHSPSWITCSGFLSLP
jgi:hypothetical protein